MDALDIRIVRTLGIAPFLAGAREGLDALKPSTVARTLGVKLELAKDRIQRMEARGVIVGYDAFPNPRLFGLEDVTFHMQVDAAAKARVLEEAARLPGVIGIYDFVGPHVCVQMFRRAGHGLDAELDALARAAGADRPPAAYFQRRPPSPARAPTNLDLRILKALRHRARTPLPDVAEAVGVGARTVKRRLAAMTQDGMFDACVELDWGKLEGVLAIDLGVEVPPERLDEATRAARAAFDDRSLADWRPPSEAFPALMMILWATTPAEVEALRRRAETLPGATRAWAVLAAGTTYSGAWLDDALDAAIARTAAAPDVQNRG